MRSAQTGTVFVREWHGTNHQVTVAKDGFMFQAGRSKLHRLAAQIPHRN